jgi:nitroreductase
LRVLESGRLSPSAGNRQERRFIVIHEFRLYGYKVTD